MTLLSVTGWMFVAAAAMAIVGAWLLWWGLRGKRIDDHPLCRKCGFDLFNKPTESQVCPECGANLANCRDVVLGHRRFRAGALSFGVVMSLPGMTLLLLLVIGNLTQFNWDSHKPVWWLVWDAQQSNEAAQENALRELNSRHSAQSLSKEQTTRIVQKGLEFQARENCHWSPAWGEIIERWRSAGDINDVDWCRYAQQALRFARSAEFPKTIYREVPVHYKIWNRGERTSTRSPLCVYERLKSISIDGIERMSSPDTGWGASNASSQGPRAEDGLPLAPAISRELNDGHHSGVLVLEAIVTDGPVAPPTISQNYSSTTTVMDPFYQRLQNAGKRRLAVVDLGLKFEFDVARPHTADEDR